jgi:IS5 family transposase
MTNAKAFDKLFKELNKQLEKHNIIVKTGAIVDASVVDTPRKPKGKVTHEVVNDREEENEETEAHKEVEQQYADSVDKEADWIKKGGKLRYGYKKHCVTDNEGLILGVLTTKANVNEISNLEPEFDLKLTFRLL